MNPAEPCDCRLIFRPPHFSGTWFMAFIRFSKCVIQTLGCWFVNVCSSSLTPLPASLPGTLKVWSRDLQHQHLLGAFENCIVLGPILTYCIRNSLTFEILM